MNWQLDNIPDLCQSDQKQKFICVGVFSFFTSSLIWGTVGPERMYGKYGLYNHSLYAFLVGAIVPIPFYLLSRWRYPQLRHIYTPIILTGGMFWAPTNMSWLIPSLYLGYIFQVYIRRRKFEWWANYNVMSDMFWAHNSIWHQMHWRVAPQLPLSSCSLPCNTTISTWTGGGLVTYLGTCAYISDVRQRNNWR